MEQGSALQLSRKRAYQHDPISLARFGAFEQPSSNGRCRPSGGSSSPSHPVDRLVPPEAVIPFLGSRNDSAYDRNWVVFCRLAILRDRWLEAEK
jgi:hypothetical protein